MKQYELLIVLPGTMEESVVSGRMKEIKAIVEKHEIADLTMIDRGKSRLAYPMKHIRYGYFHIIRFTADGSIIPEIQKELGLMRDLLRALVSTYDPTKRDETQKKLGRTEDGPMKTLASVFERFGGEKSADSKEEAEDAAPRVKKETKEIETEKEVPKKAEETKDSTEKEADTKEESPSKETEKEAEEPKSMEDIDKKLDQLLEDDLKTV